MTNKLISDVASPVTEAARKQYLVEPYRFVGQTTIVEIINGERPIIRLDTTWFHPQGGGQKADRGRIGSAQVLHVAHNASQVDHHVDSANGLKPGMTIDFEIDISWRALNAAYHTAGHLVACVGEALAPGINAVAGHQWPGEARVEFDANPTLTAGLTLQSLNERLAADISHKLPVQVRNDPMTHRSIQIGDYPPIPCGGTHVESLAAMAAIRVLSLKSKSGRLRVSYDIDLMGSAV